MSRASRRPSTSFRRSIKAAKDAGLQIIRIEMDADKTILVVKDDETTEKKINPFDTAPTPWSQKRKKKCASD